MGKTKTKIIDDSLPQEEVKKSEPKKKGVVKDELVEKLKAELGIDQKDSEKLRIPADQNSGKSEISETTGAPSLSEFSGTTKIKKPQKPTKSKPRSKKYQEASKDLDKTKSYALNEAVEIVKKISYSKFNGTLEAHINTVQTGIRGLVSLPFASGKKLRILAFGKGAVDSGADIVGDESTIEEINKGKVSFDLVVTTPEWMPKLAKVARILGPRGIMPNPKNGTITDPSADGLKKAVESFQTGKTEYKTESKAPVIHLGLGKLDQPTEELTSNIKTLLQTVGKTRIKKITLAPTMGPSVKIDLSSI